MSPIEFDSAGLVPGIIQDATTRKVLMLGYLSRESLELTRQTGRVHFWSRSRKEIWEKGATSGNYLNVVEIAPDCDGDALLITVNPAGPTCHTGAVSCFGDEPSEGFADLEALWRTIRQRLAEPGPGSYTAHLAAGGPDLPGRKLVEEATETLIAAKNHAAGGPAERLVEEAADVVYHLLALLATEGVAAADVLAELRRRRD
jgi:phosphoribosyl-ATP pyrophosphohydrolase/phosphoribosyl-AMP cyclohydrolase